ncbi:hypothetical protein, partial [Vibrio cholerae]|uniref:hypothetical protein n=1 Tax=Vibrio cholerae TaxID=666 RepID=UPI002FDBF8AA
QRITTKLKHNSRNHRGSMGLETQRVGSPFEAFVMLKLQHFTFDQLKNNPLKSFTKLRLSLN